MGIDVKVALASRIVSSADFDTEISWSFPTGLGTPKGCVVMFSAAKNFSSFHNNINGGFALCDGSASYAVTFNDAYNASTTDGAEGGRSDARPLVYTDYVPGGIAGRNRFYSVTYSTDSVSLRFNPLSAGVAEDMVVGILAFGGGDCYCVAGEATFPTSVGESATFTHNLNTLYGGSAGANYMVFGFGNNQPSGTEQQNNRCTIGAGVAHIQSSGATITQAATGWVADDNSSPVDMAAGIYRVSGGSNFMTHPIATGSNYNDEVVSIIRATNDTFTFEKIKGDLSTRISKVLVVDIGDLPAKVFDVDSHSVQSATWSVTTPGFQPKAIGVFQNYLTQANTNTVSEECDGFGWGYAAKQAGQLDELNVGHINNNNVSPSFSKSYARSATFYLAIGTSATATDVWNCTSLAFTATGWSAETVKVDGTRIHAGWAIGEPANHEQVDLNAQTFSFASNALTTFVSSLIAFNSAAFTFTSNAVNLAVASLVELNAQAFNFTSKAVNTKVSTLVDFAAGSFNYTAQTVTVVSAQIVALGVAAFTTTAKAVSVLEAVVINLLSATFTMTPKAVSSNFATVVGLASTTFTMTSNALSVLLAETIALGGAAFTFTARQISQQLSTVVSLGAASFTLTPRAIQALGATLIGLSKAAFTFTATTFTAVQGTLVTLGAATFTVTAKAVTPAVDVVVRLQTAVFDFSRQSIGGLVSFKNTVVRMGQMFGRFWRRG